MTATSKAPNRPERKPLTADRLREAVHYDPDTGIMMWTKARTGRTVGATVGSKMNKGALICRFDYRIYYVHRLAWLYMTGAWPLKFIDHINGNPADNRWANLREADRAQNAHNTKCTKANTSGYKDVAWFKPERVWRVVIKVRGKNHFIGRFHDKSAAIAARNEALLRLHGAYARLD